MSCLDADARVVEHLTSAGVGDRTFTRVLGELITLLRAYVTDAESAGALLNGIKAGEQTDRDLGIALRLIKEHVEKNIGALFEPSRARAIVGKLELVRAAARAANVLILSKGPIESYYAKPPGPRASDFEKQQALQGELDAIWQESNVGALEMRYAEILDFLRDAGFLKVPIAEQVREPIANLIHILQTEISTGRVKTLDAARECSRAVADGYWHVCQLTSLEIVSPTSFKGTLKVKEGLGGEVVNFSNNTRAYELATLASNAVDAGPTAAQLNTEVDGRLAPAT
jgi:hypothetical protein